MPKAAQTKALLGSKAPEIASERPSCLDLSWCTLIITSNRAAKLSNGASVDKGPHQTAGTKALHLSSLQAGVIDGPRCIGNSNKRPEHVVIPDAARLSSTACVSPYCLALLAKVTELSATLAMVTEAPQKHQQRAQRPGHHHGKRPQDLSPDSTHTHMQHGRWSAQSPQPRPGLKAQRAQSPWETQVSQRQHSQAGPDAKSGGTATGATTSARRSQVPPLRQSQSRAADRNCQRAGQSENWKGISERLSPAGTEAPPVPPVAPPLPAAGPGTASRSGGAAGTSGARPSCSPGGASGRNQ